MREGEHYPELRNMTMTRTELTERVEPMPNWSLSRAEMMQEWRNATVHTRTIEGVKIVMPREDFERMMSIYRAHYHAANHNPAVADAWHQYRMLVALTDR